MVVLRNAITDTDDNKLTDSNVESSRGILAEHFQLSVFNWLKKSRTSSRLLRPLYSFFDLFASSFKFANRIRHRFSPQTWQFSYITAQLNFPIRADISYAGQANVRHACQQSKLMEITILYLNKKETMAYTNLNLVYTSSSSYTVLEHM